jgi:hypothetical protein
MAGLWKGYCPYREIIFGARMTAADEAQVRHAVGSRSVRFYRAVLEIGLRNGLSVGEIEEALIQATAHAGFPAAYAASNAAAEVLRDLESRRTTTPDSRFL